MGGEKGGGREKVGYRRLVGHAVAARVAAHTATATAPTGGAFGSRPQRRRASRPGRQQPKAGQRWRRGPTPPPTTPPPPPLAGTVRLAVAARPLPHLSRLPRHGLRPQRARAHQGAAGEPTAAARVVNPLPLTPAPSSTTPSLPVRRAPTAAGGAAAAGGRRLRAELPGGTATRPRPAAAWRSRPVCASVAATPDAAELADWRPPHGDWAAHSADAGQTAPPPRVGGSRRRERQRVSPRRRSPRPSAERGSDGLSKRVQPTVVIWTPERQN